MQLASSSDAAVTKARAMHHPNLPQPSPAPLCPSVFCAGHSAGSVSMLLPANCQQAQSSWGLSPLQNLACRTDRAMLFQLFQSPQGFINAMMLQIRCPQQETICCQQHLYTSCNQPMGQMFSSSTSCISFVHANSPGVDLRGPRLHQLS